MEAQAPFKHSRTHISLERMFFTITTLSFSCLRRGLKERNWHQLPTHSHNFLSLSRPLLYCYSCACREEGDGVRWINVCRTASWNNSWLGVEDYKEVNWCSSSITSDWVLSHTTLIEILFRWNDARRHISDESKRAWNVLVVLATPREGRREYAANLQFQRQESLSLHWNCQIILLANEIKLAGDFWPIQLLRLDLPWNEIYCQSFAFSSLHFTGWESTDNMRCH